MKRALFIILIVITTFTITISGCKKKPDENAENQDETIFAVNTTTAIKGEINDYIELNGDVKTKIEVSIYPDVMGKLNKFQKKLGDYVRKNDVIAYIDPSKPGMEFQLSPVKSTISGTITDLPVEIGATVSQQNVIAKVGKLDEIEIVTYVAERFISKMSNGLDAIITTQAFPEEKIYAEIKEISPVVDPMTRMLEVKLKPVSKTNKLMPGLFVQIKIITEQKNNIVKIPSECVIKRYGGYYVFVVKRQDENKAIVEKKEVTTGISIGNKIEIIKGIEEGNEIVMRGQTMLEEGSKVRIIESYQPLTKEDVIE